MARLENLPESMQPVAQVVGVAGALKLMDRYGGDRVYVPQRLTLFHPLVDLLGLEAALALSFAYGGDYLAVPVGVAMRCQARNERLWRLRQQGWSYSQIRQEFNLSRRRIAEILALCRGKAAPVETDEE